MSTSVHSSPNDPAQASTPPLCNTYLPCIVLSHHFNLFQLHLINVISWLVRCILSDLDLHFKFLLCSFLLEQSLQPLMDHWPTKVYVPLGRAPTPGPMRGSCSRSINTAFQHGTKVGPFLSERGMDMRDTTVDISGHRA